MSKRDFIALADAIREHNEREFVPFTFYQLKALADFCASTNPRFNRSRWLDYIAGKCGPSGGEVK